MGCSWKDDAMASATARSLAGSLSSRPPTTLMCRSTWQHVHYTSRHAAISVQAFFSECTSGPLLLHNQSHHITLLARGMRMSWHLVPQCRMILQEQGQAPCRGACARAWTVPQESGSAGCPSDRWARALAARLPARPAAPPNTAVAVQVLRCSVLACRQHKTLERCGCSDAPGAEPSRLLQL